MIGIDSRSSVKDSPKSDERAKGQRPSEPSQSPRSRTALRSGKSRNAGTAGLLEKNGDDVYTVRRGNPAEAAGQHTEDVIVSVDGKSYSTN